MFKNKNKDDIVNFFEGSNYIINTFSKNQIIALEGSPCKRVGLILSGSIDIKRALSSNNVIHLSSLGFGQFFGEVIAFSDTSIYPATVISASPSEIMLIDKKDFINFCTSHPDFLEMFLNDLTNKIMTLNKSITTLSLSNIRQKISNYLLTEYKLQQTNFIKINMTKQKLSEILGVPRPSLSRELANMRSDLIIDYSRDFIKILNLKALEEVLTD